MKKTSTKDQPLIEALAEAAPDSSKTSLREWIKEGRITVDGKFIKQPSYPVYKGQTVAIGSRKRYLPGEIEILYEDQDIVVIYKPEGLLSVSTDYEHKLTALSILRENYYPKFVHVVHRLDQETSGVMMFALNEKACDKLKDMFEKHDLDRRYTAIVQGFPEPFQGTWHSYLWEDQYYVVHSSDDATKGQEATTHYKMLGKSKTYSWLNITLETGRKNQIRVHCQQAGHPISGDKKYGGKASPIRRLCLHAHYLAFRHPSTGKQLKFEYPVPEEFYRMVKPRHA